MTTELEIIDTAIKVGLGALISGVTTYFVTMRNHSHEIRKSLLNEKKDLLREAAIKIERGSTLGNEIKDSIYLIAISAETAAKKEIKFRETMKTFTTALNHVKEAGSLFSMIGQQELADLTGDYFDSIEEEQRYYDEKTLNYDVEILNGLTDKQSQLKKKILAKLAKAFDSIFS